MRSISLAGLVVSGCGHAATAAVLAPALAPPSCIAPLPLTPGAPLRASTLLGRDLLTASCVRGAAPECRYTFEVARPSALRAALESGTFDGALALFRRDEPATSSPGPGQPLASTELRCNDDAPSGDVRHARLDATLAPGSYELVVDGSNGEAGEFELFAELEPLPSLAEVCAEAPPLSASVPLRDSSRGATSSFAGSCGGDGPEHVHTLVLDQPSRVRLRQQSERDGTLYLRAGCDDPDRELACSDGVQRGAEALVAAALDPGTYYVFSDTLVREAGGEYVLSLEQHPAPAPRSLAAQCEELASRTPLGSGQYELDTLTATSSASGTCGGDGPELLLPVRIARPSTLYAQLEAPEFNGVLYLRRACGDTDSELACQSGPRVDRPPSESPPPLTATLGPGLYTLVVDGHDPGDLGAATLDLLIAPR